MTREEAIKILKKEMEGLVLILEKPLDRNPSGTLEALEMAISALSDYDKIQKISLDLAFENDELMNKMNELSADGDCISRQAVFDVVEKAVTKEVAMWSIKELPSVENKGEWIKDEKMSIVFDIYRCSCCSAGGEPRYKFCPYCGARMKGGE